MDSIAHIDWPIRVSANAYASCQQDTSQEIAANIAVLFSFQRATRIEQPDFGITDPTFAQMPVDTTDLERQAARYEPRADLDVSLTTEGDGAQQVRVAVRVATIQEGDL